MVNNAGYIGFTGASSTAVSVVADIAESLDISGFTPAIAVSSIPALAVSSIVLTSPIAVSGTVTTAAPANQNVSGISLDAIKAATEATQASTATLQADLGNLSGVLNTIVTTSAVDVSGTSLDVIQADTALVKAQTANLDTKLDTLSTDLGALSGVLNTIVTTSAVDVSGTSLDAIKVATETVQDLQTNVIDSNNSTTVTLSGGATWTGTGTDVLKYAVVATSIKASHNSAADGFAIEFSPDNSNWDESTTFTLEADVTRRYQYPVTARYYRVKLTNGGSAQSYLRVQTILHADMIPGSIHKVDNGTERGDRTCQLVKSVLQAKKPNGDFINIDATNGGNLKVSVEEVEDVIFPVSGTSLDAIQTAVETIDNAIDGNYLNVNANIAGTDFVGGAGAVNAGTLRTTLATDDSSIGIMNAIKTAVESDTTVNGNVTAVVAFPAITSITGGGVESGAQRVTIANDSTGSVGIKPSTSSYLSHVYIDLDAAGDNPTTNTEVIAAPGASTKLVIYGVQGSIAGSAATAFGNWFLSDGNTSAATTLWTARAQGTTNTQFELTFPYGVALTANTALKVTSSEGSGNIFINAVVYYRTEAT